MPVLSTLGAAIANVYGFTSGLIKDQYFNLVSLLLPGNGTNGAQNNTFLDSSSNTFTITRNGNTTQGTFSPFSPTGWGAYFDGSNDYVSVANNTVLDLSTADFCIGFWIYPTAGGTFRRILQWQNGNASNTNYGYAIHIESSNQVSLRCWSGTTGYVITNNTSALQISAWNWVCVTRSGTSGNVYVNGTGVSGTTPTTINNPTSSLLYISGDLGSADPLLGYLSGMQIVKGSTTALSTTAPTSPYTAVSGTSLLTFQYNRFRDASSNTLTVTPNNGVAITPFSPFAPTQSYSAAAVGGSGYFDGTLDYLSIASTSAALPTGTQDYSVEAWVYWGTQGASFPQIITNPATDGFQISYDVSGGTLSIGRYGVASVVSYTVAQSALANQWTHILATRSGNTHRLFVNGVLRGNAVNTISFAALTTQTIASAGAGNYFVGYISGIRTVLGSIPTTYQTSSTTNGTAIFDPPTAPPTTTSQGSSAPSLLLNFTNAGVVDATAKNVLETVGTAQISNGAAKFGTTSIYLNGDGNYLTSRGSPVFSLNGDFTMEAWVYPINAGRSADAEKYGTIVSCSAPGVNSPEFSWFVRIVGSSITEYFLNINGTTVLQVTGLSVSLNAWHYFAVTRSGTGTGNLKLYIDGNLVGTSSGASTQSPTFSSSQTLMVGRNANSSTYQNWLSGYFQGVRITPGYVRTVTTVPTAPFPVQ